MMKLSAWLHDPKDKRWQKIARERHLRGQAGETTLIFDPPTLLLGASAHDKNRAIFEAAIRAVAVARQHHFDEVELGGVPKESAEVAARGLDAGGYVFRRKSTKKKVKDVRARLSGRQPDVAPITEAVRFARDLVNMSPDEKSPARIAAMIARKTRAEIWDEKRLARERCNGILAVGRGSSNPPRAMILRYSPKGAKKEIALVGKGVTFDSGGLCIKPYEGMKTMKCDMAGAAAVVGAFLAISHMKINVRVTAYVGFVENMLGPDAFKPGDIVTMRSGKTVEVLNTDAEGRIVLGDLLDLAYKSKADHIIDLATLTGACLVALGEETAGLFSIDDALAKKIERAAEDAGESIWRLPLGRDHREKIKSQIADIKNVGNRYGGASSAAQFLADFVADRSWAHLDIAGPAFRESGSSGRPAGGTGFGVATLVELARLLSRD